MASKWLACQKYNRISNDGQLYCHDCNKPFKVKNNLQKHLLTHLPQSEWPFVCLFCGKHMQAKSDLPKHFSTPKHVIDPRIPKTGTIEWEKLMKKSQVMEWPPKI